jgi:hypothetical protein
MIKMFENNLQTGGAVEQAIGMFEVSSKLEITENNGEIIVRR